MLGIGEDLRTTQAALGMLGIPSKVIDIPTKQISEKIRKEADSDPENLAPYSINIFCMTAEEHARVVLELGYKIINERYNIGYWPWELSKWPQEWEPLFSLTDEVWASSKHTYDIFKKSAALNKSPKVSYLPLCIEELRPLKTKEKIVSRKKFNLPPDKKLIICSFDGRSSFWRKNPWGAIHAFQKAFSDRSIFNDCVLVVKTMNASSDLKENKKLKRLAASDQRITLLDAKLDRKDLIRLYGCCDILLSLHRAEGFGRIIAESLLLGLKVVTTDYSGNKDFCTGDSVYKVSYIKTFVPEGTYTHARGKSGQNRLSTMHLKNF